MNTRVSVLLCWGIVASAQCRKLTTLRSSDVLTYTDSRTVATTERTTTAPVLNTTLSPPAPTYPTRPISEPDASQREIRLCVAIERSSALFYDYRRLAAAIDMGVEYVNSRVLQNGYHITQQILDIGGQCLRKNEAVTHAALDMALNNVTCHAYLGPGCGYNADKLHNLAEYTQTPIIACPAAGAALSAERNAYALLVRASFAHKDAINFICRFLEENDYDHVTVIMDSAEF